MSSSGSMQVAVASDESLAWWVLLDDAALLDWPGCVSSVLLLCLGIFEGGSTEVVAFAGAGGTVFGGWEDVAYVAVAVTPVQSLLRTSL